MILVPLAALPGRACLHGRGDEAPVFRAESRRQVEQQGVLLRTPRHGPLLGGHRGRDLHHVLRISGVDTRGCTFLLRWVVVRCAPTPVPRLKGKDSISSLFLVFRRGVAVATPK